MRCDQHPKRKARWYVRAKAHHVFNLCDGCGKRVRRETPNVAVKHLYIQSR